MEDALAGRVRASRTRCGPRRRPADWAARRQRRASASVRRQPQNDEMFTRCQGGDGDRCEAEDRSSSVPGNAPRAAPFKARPACKSALCVYACLRVSVRQRAPMGRRVYEIIANYAPADGRKTKAKPRVFEAFAGKVNLPSSRPFARQWDALLVSARGREGRKKRPTLRKVDLRPTSPPLLVRPLLCIALASM